MNHLAMTAGNSLGDLIAPEDARLLNQLGFCAVGNGLDKEARAIFAGLLRARPQRSFPYVGLALAHINAQRYDEAIVVLQKAGSVQADERHEIDAFLGLALQLAGRGLESRQVLKDVVKGAPESAALVFARELLADAPPVNLVRPPF